MTNFNIAGRTVCGDLESGRSGTRNVRGNPDDYGVFMGFIRLTGCSHIFQIDMRSTNKKLRVQSVIACARCDHSVNGHPPVDQDVPASPQKGDVAKSMGEFCVDGFGPVVFNEEEGKKSIGELFEGKYGKNPDDYFWNEFAAKAREHRGDIVDHAHRAYLCKGKQYKLRKKPTPRGTDRKPSDTTKSSAVKSEDQTSASSFAPSTPSATELAQEFTASSAPPTPSSFQGGAPGRFPPPSYSLIPFDLPRPLSAASITMTEQKSTTTTNTNTFQAPVGVVRNVSGGTFTGQMSGWTPPVVSINPPARIGVDEANLSGRNVSMPMTSLSRIIDASKAIVRLEIPDTKSNSMAYGTAILGESMLKVVSVLDHVGPTAKTFSLPSYSCHSL
jgi:hypothetical protein